MTPAAVEPWIREATRLHRRYLLEIVEACGLCPWAVQARLANRVREAVLVDDDGEVLLGPSLAMLERWGADPSIEVGFLIYPRLLLSRVDFDQFTARLRDADTERYGIGAAPFALAAFHPHADAVMDDPERLVPFLRRTPDPCIQIVRMSSLARVRARTPEGTKFFDISQLDAALGEAEGPPLRERIARANFETVKRMGVEQLRERLDAIRRDRDATYRTLPGDA